jgi:hypothetical protein
MTMNEFASYFGTHSVAFILFLRIMGLICSHYLPYWLTSIQKKIKSCWVLQWVTRVFSFDTFSCEYWVLNLCLVSIQSEYHSPYLPFHNGVSPLEPSRHLNAMTLYI